MSRTATGTHTRTPTRKQGGRYPERRLAVSTQVSAVSCIVLPTLHPPCPWWVTAGKGSQTRVQPVTLAGLVQELAHRDLTLKTWLALCAGPLRAPTHCTGALTGPNVKSWLLAKVWPHLLAQIICLCIWPYFPSLKNKGSRWDLV